MEGLVKQKSQGYNLVVCADSLEVYKTGDGVMVSLFNIDDSLNHAEVIKQISLDKIIEAFGADHILDYIGTKAINEFLTYGA